MIRGLNIVSIRSQFREVFQQADTKMVALLRVELNAIYVPSLNRATELKTV
ncbi:hypothetical protein D3C80_2198980 [compost metagenome]